MNACCLALKPLPPPDFLAATDIPSGGHRNQGPLLLGNCKKTHEASGKDLELKIANLKAAVDEALVAKKKEGLVEPKPLPPVVLEWLKTSGYSIAESTDYQLLKTKNGAVFACATSASSVPVDPSSAIMCRVPTAVATSRADSCSPRASSSTRASRSRSASAQSVAKRRRRNFE